ncbi:MAG: MFS transporter [Prolixibacteraceae bacterium]|jgi:FHS family L-fucose permease-like MFS transporter|nr:MFS transporter [Prolixibacteraceae bacterium]
MGSSIFQAENGKKYLFPFIIIASLFFLSGYTNALLDVLNKYFQEVLHISRAESGLVQFSLYSGYFIMAIPAGIFIHRFGYNKSLILGLLILITGTILFIPGAYVKSYYVFLVALFVIACGFSFFEIIANPYATFLGNEHAATRRINLVQAFNGIGWIFGPLLGGLIIFNKSSGEYHFNNLPIPFIFLGIGILIILILIIRKPLPELSDIKKDNEKDPGKLSSTTKPFYKYPHFVLAIFAQFFYVAGQTGINSFFINYVTETNQNISNQSASVMLAFGGMSLFILGRFSGSWFMKFINPSRLLTIFSVACMVLVALVIMKLPFVSIAALCAVYFFMSIMYPTIFALGIKDLGEQVKKASSYIVMGIVGGAFCPMLMGKIADTYSMTIGFIVPLVCFSFVFLYAYKGCKLR